MTWAPSYCSGAELASWLGVENEGIELALATEAASRAIDQACGRSFGVLDEAEARWYDPTWFKDRWSVDIDDLTTDASLVIEVDNDQDGTPEAEITAYRLLPVNAPAKAQPWTRVEVLPSAAVKPNGLRHSVKVTARWGWTTVPNAIKLATLVQAARWFDRKNSVGGALTKLDVDDVGMGWAVQRNELDDDVAAMIRGYRRLWVAA